MDSEQYLPYTGAYIGAYTYCAKMLVDNGLEFSVGHNKLFYNLQIGKFNSIGQNLKCIFGRNHNYKNISTGAVQLMFQESNVPVNGKSAFNQKGSIIIQNDVWFGENVTIMSGIIVRNGAVVARNSHVVSDVPPYAIVGGNPAKVIGYRYSKEHIEKLQLISWWDWEYEKIIANSEFFSEDVDAFCDKFYEEAKGEFESYISRRCVKEDTYFCFVDYYENYSVFSTILERFLDTYISNPNKKLLLFVQEDNRVGKMKMQFYEQMRSVVDEINADKMILCSIEIVNGLFEDAKECFLHCSHYITNRTYDTVYFSCLADRMGIEIVSGVDSNVQFEKKQNMYRFDKADKL